MSFSFGFYNAQNHDRRYDALQMSMIFDGIIEDGVYATIGKAFAVLKSELENTVIVSPGRAWFNHTWNYNDTNLPVDATRSDILLDRYDALVIDINSNVSYRENKLLWVEGTPSDDPQKPTMIHTAEHNQYPLAYIYRKANTDTISQEQIENAVGTKECPFVTGVLKSIDIDVLLQQWRDQWNNFITDFENNSDSWLAQEQNDFLSYKTAFESQMSEFFIAFGQEFSDWFSNLQDLMSDNVATKLQNEIDTLTKNVFNKYYGLVSKTTEIKKVAGSNQITETTSEATATTTFSKDDAGATIITTVLSPFTGSFKYTKTVTIQKVDNGKTITESYSQSPK